MTVEALECFYLIAQGKTFMAVAEEKNLSQSSLSKMIRRLEEEIGITLFNREGRSVKLTAAGRQVFDDLTLLRPGYETLKQHLQVLSSRRRIQCMLDFPGSGLGIRNILECFNIDHPEVPLFLYQRPPARSLTMPESEHQQQSEISDYVIMHQSLKPDHRMESIILFEDHLQVIVPKKNPLYRKEKICFSDLTQESFLVNYWGQQFLSMCEEYLGVTIPDEQISHTNAGREDIVWKIVKNQAVTLFYASDLATIDIFQARAVPLADIPAQPLVLSWKKNMTKTGSHELFCQYVTHELKKNPIFFSGLLKMHQQEEGKPGRSS